MSSRYGRKKRRAHLAQIEALTERIRGLDWHIQLVQRDNARLHDASRVALERASHLIQERALQILGDRTATAMLQVEETLHERIAREVREKLGPYKLRIRERAPGPSWGATRGEEQVYIFTIAPALPNIELSFAVPGAEIRGYA